MSLNDNVRAWLAKQGQKSYAARVQHLVDRGMTKKQAKEELARISRENGRLGKSGRPTLEEQGKPLTYAARKKRESRARLANKEKAKG